MVSQTGNAYLNGKTGEVSITGKFATSSNERRIVIDPAGYLRMYDGNFLILDINYETDASANVTRIPFLISRAYNKNTGSVISETKIVPGSVSVSDLSGAEVKIFPGGMIFNVDRFPSSVTSVGVGQVYRDGGALRIKTS